MKIEDLDGGLIENYPISDTKLDTENGEQVKRWIPDTETYPDGTNIST